MAAQDKEKSPINPFCATGFFLCDKIDKNRVDSKQGKFTDELELLSRSREGTRQA
jgi:hypothetical protein